MLSQSTKNGILSLFGHANAVYYVKMSDFQSLREQCKTIEDKYESVVAENRSLREQNEKMKLNEERNVTRIKCFGQPVTMGAVVEVHQTYQRLQANLATRTVFRMQFAMRDIIREIQEASKEHMEDTEALLGAGRKEQLRLITRPERKLLQNLTDDIKKGASAIKTIAKAFDYETGATLGSELNQIDDESDE